MKKKKILLFGFAVLAIVVALMGVKRNSTFNTKSLILQNVEALSQTSDNGETEFEDVKYNSVMAMTITTTDYHMHNSQNNDSAWYCEIKTTNKFWVCEDEGGDMFCPKNRIISKKSDHKKTGDIVVIYKK